VRARLGVCIAGGSARVVLEFVSGGALRSYIDKGKAFSESEMADLLLSIAIGLKHLHESKLIHRDLAARNILIDEGENGEMIPKISDCTHRFCWVCVLV